MRQQHIKQDEYPYFLTTNVAERNRFFEEGKWAEVIGGIIRRACVLHRYTLLGFVVMPDHVHILIYPNQAQASVPASKRRARAGRDARAGSSVGTFMHTIKSFFVHQVYDLDPGNNFHWQSGYNSRVMNSSERLQTIVEYMKYNPTKAGLDKRFKKLPYLYINTKRLQSL
jgi:REP element-mobilizing transposase RayT